MGEQRVHEPRGGPPGSGVANTPSREARVEDTPTRIFKLSRGLSEMEIPGV